MTDLPALPRPIDTMAISVSPQIRKIETTEAERAEIARKLDLVEMPVLKAEFEVRRGGRGRIHVDGRVVADIVQSCVVSLEPVPQRIDEPVSLVFYELGDKTPRDDDKPGGEIKIDPSEDDPPEPLTGSALDLGAILMEHLVLAIDPYPRAPGASLPDDQDDESAAPSDSPFAALANLKGKSRGK